MSRPIKFRAWDVTARRMITSGFAIDPQRGVEAKTTEQWGHLLELMQLTGLKDKNGVPIYEGDVLNIEGHDFSPMTFIVEWVEVNHCWWFTSVKKKYMEWPAKTFSFSDLNGLQTDSEVIGDIYRNPELLES